MARVENVCLPDDRYYDPREHLWARIEDDGRVRVGIDELGRWAAGTVSFVHLHAVGKRINRRGAPLGTLEANKFVGPLRAPVRGIIAEVNREILEDPALVNTDPYGRGWFVVLAPSHLQEDIESLLYGEKAIIEYLRNKIAEYRDKGILPADEAPGRAKESPGRLS